LPQKNEKQQQKKVSKKKKKKKTRVARQTNEAQGCVGMFVYVMVLVGRLTLSGASSFLKDSS